MKKFVISMLCLAAFSFAANALNGGNASPADTLNLAVSPADTVNSVVAPAKGTDDSMVLFEEAEEAVQDAVAGEGTEGLSAEEEARQINPKDVGLHRYLDGMKLDGMTLTKDQQLEILQELSAADGLDYVSEWEKYRKGRGVGVGLIIGGSTLATAGAAVVVGAGLVYIVCVIFVAFGGQEAVDNLGRQFAPWLAGGAIAVGAGAAVAIAGIPITVSNCNKMSGITNRYNQPASAPVATLTFGRTRSGIGLALNF